MAAVIRRSSRLCLRSLTAVSAQSRPAYRCAVSPLLKKNIKLEWNVDFNTKYLCTHVQNVVNVDSDGGEVHLANDGTMSGDGEDSELSGTSLSDLHRISQRLGSVRNEETLIEAFEVIKNAQERDVQPLLVYQLIRNCGTQLFTCMPEKRTELVNRFWDELKQKGIKFAVNHYNILLSVYLQNHHSFSPLEILEDMKHNKIEPNQTTLVLFIQAFSEKGDMAGSLEILNTMKSLEIPVTEQVYASLITGYSHIGDMDSALGIVDTMRENGLEPGLDTYMALLTAHSEQGDIENIRKTLDDYVEKRGMYPVSVLMGIVQALARTKHYDIIPQILKEMNINQSVFNSELINVLKNMISRGLHDNALELLKVIPRNHMINSERLSVPEVEFMRQLVLSIEDNKTLISMIKKVDVAKIMKNPFELSLNFSFGKHNRDLSLSIIETMTKKGLIIRPHYFYPLMVDAIKNNDGKGAIETLTFIRQRNLRLDNNLVHYGKKAVNWENQSPHDLIKSMENLGDNALTYHGKVTALHLFTERLSLEDVKEMVDASNGELAEDNGFIPCLELMIKRDDRTSDAVEAILYAEKKGLDIQSCVLTLVNRISRTRNSSQNLLAFIEALFEKNINAGSKVFSRALSYLSKDDTTEEFFELLRILKRNNIEPDAYSYREILKKSSNMGRKDAAEFAFAKVTDAFPDDEAAFSYLLLAYAKNNVGNLGFTSDFKNRSKITAIFDQMVERGIKPFDAAVSHAIIAHLTKGNIEMADKIKETYGTGSRNFIVYSQYLRFFSKKGDVHNSERIMNEMKEMNKDLSAYTYNYLLQAYRKHGDVDKIKELLQDMTKQNIPTIYMNYSELMMAQLKCGDLDGCWQIYKDKCQSEERFPTDPCLVHMMREMGSRKEIDKLNELFSDITRSSFHATHDKNRLSHGLLVAYLDADAHDKVQEICEREDFKHENAHYRSVARNAAGLGKVELLRKLMVFIENNNLKPKILYEPLLYAYGKRNDITGAYALRDEIISRGDSQTTVFTALFERLVENAKRQQMEDNTA